MRLNFMRSDRKDEKERFHKNLFIDEFSNRTDGYCSDQDRDDDDDDYDTKYFKFNNLSLPLTDTIAEFVQDLSEDQFFLNDLSFIFEMSRKRAISPYAIIVALLYLKRLKTKITQSNFENKSLWSCYSARNLIDTYFKPKQNEFENFTNSELCLISILLASKFLIDEGEDDEIYNDQWAEAIDLPVQRINQLEKKFLNKMEWEMYVSSDEFWKFTHELTEKATRKKVKLQLGNCTYSDLDALLSFSSQFSVLSIYKSFQLLLKIFFVCSSTLLYVTLSTYLVSTSVMLIKNQLVNTQFNLLNNTKNLNTPSTLISIDTNSSGNLNLEIMANYDEVVPIVNRQKFNKDIFIKTKSKPCVKTVNNLTSLDFQMKQMDHFSQPNFLANDFFKQTFKLLF
ncbi:unnamed protein product [Brachionus calyciflorus]|uniref:Protein CNPPD1 n=1 Tax=Brachionus calyciflorus TaxID=104777 RepID=A0A813PYF7_9BILA|nr:unnamed protein product [Brachionus calyciflorus]